MAEYDLKRCPFCGSQADVWQTKNKKSEGWFVFCKCNMCGSTGKVVYSKNEPSSQDWGNDSCVSAVVAWNTRV